MTSTFITQIQSQLQPDPNKETAALLRILIYKIDNTTFGDDVPIVPQWSGPLHTIIQVQSILYASLAGSLFSALLAMLGKQWLNRYSGSYTSTDARGSAIERSQNRQRKLDGIITWYFDHVIESLPLMLQLALLLLGCALSRYLWGVDTTIACVVLGVTSFGVASYTFFLIAGAASASCPYQSPGARILRHIPPLALSTLRSAFSNSKLISLLTNWWHALKLFRCSLEHVARVPIAILLLPIVLPTYLVIDAHLLARVATRAFAVVVRRVRDWFHRPRGWDPRTAALDLQCISWMLRTPLDKTVHLLTLRSLAAMTTLASFDPALISTCFDILVGCVSITGGKVVILQGSEEFAALSAQCCLRMLAHFTTVDPASGFFEDMRRRYTKTFPIEADFEGLSFYHRLSILHNIFYPSYKRVLLQDLYSRSFHRPRIEWKDHKLSSAEHVAFVQLARFKYRGNRPQKVPRWILRFTHHLLSQDTLPPASVVANCLSIIAMDLGHTVSNAATMDDRYVHIWQISTFLTKGQCAAGGAFRYDNLGT